MIGAELSEHVSLETEYLPPSVEYEPLPGEIESIEACRKWALKWTAEQVAFFN